MKQVGHLTIRSKDGEKSRIQKGVERPDDFFLVCLLTFGIHSRNSAQYSWVVKVGGEEDKEKWRKSENERQFYILPAAQVRSQTPQSSQAVGNSKMG